MNFLSHIHLGISDFALARRFYEPLMAELGLVTRHVDPAAGWMAWGTADAGRPLFMIGLPYDRRPVHPGNGPMVAFSARSRSVVDRCHALAITLGGTDDGSPGLRPHYHADYYGAYVRDPDGNKLCIVCHDPE